MPDNTRERFSQLVFYALIILIGYLTYLVMSPFLASLAWAAVFAVMFHRVHVELSPRIGHSRAALASTLMAAVLIVAPAAMLVSVVAREVSQAAPERIQRIWVVVRRHSPAALPEDPGFLVREGVQRVLGFVAPHVGGVV